MALHQHPVLLIMVMMNLQHEFGKDTMTYTLVHVYFLVPYILNMMHLQWLNLNKEHSLNHL